MNTKIKTVVIGNGITKIGEMAFYQCTSLKTVKKGKSVASVGDTAFIGTKWANPGSKLKMKSVTYNKKTGKVTVQWNKVKYAKKYSIVKNTHAITEENSSQTSEIVQTAKTKKIWKENKNTTSMMQITPCKKLGTALVPMNKSFYVTYEIDGNDKFKAECKIESSYSMNIGY